MRPETGGRIRLCLSKPQWTVYNGPESTETYFIAGVGSGKTFLLTLLLLRASTVKGAVNALLAPTNKVFRQSTWKQVESTLNSLGYQHGVHYVYNINPPEHWGIAPFGTAGSQGILTFAWGSYAICGGVLDPDTLRGAELDEVLLDEYREMSDETRGVLLGRLRGKAYRDAGKKHRIWYCTTPPADVSALIQLRDKHDPDIRFVFGTTYDNVKNLPAGYIESLKSRYDSNTFAREVLAELINPKGQRWAYEFDYDYHVEACDYDRALPIELSFDFNVNPGTCLISQSYGKRICVIDEVYLIDSDLRAVCEAVKAKIPKGMQVMVTGDATGRNRSHLTGQQTSYRQIAEYLNLHTEDFYVPTKNPPHQASYSLCNLILREWPVSIHPQCKELIRDLSFVQTDEKYSPQPGPENRGHILDCFRYNLNTFHVEQVYG